MNWTLLFLIWILPIIITLIIEYTRLPKNTTFGDLKNYYSTVDIVFLFLPVVNMLCCIVFTMKFIFDKLRNVRIK